MNWSLELECLQRFKPFSLTRSAIYVWWQLWRKNAWKRHSIRLLIALLFLHSYQLLVRLPTHKYFAEICRITPWLRGTWYYVVRTATLLQLSLCLASLLCPGLSFVAIISYHRVHLHSFAAC